MGTKRHSSHPTAPRLSVGPNSRFVQQLSRFNVGLELTKKRWICEPALWVKGWQTHGELICLVNSVLLLLESSRLKRVISAFPFLHFDIAIYANWVVQEIKSYEGELSV